MGKQKFFQACLLLVYLFVAHPNQSPAQVFGKLDPHIWLRPETQNAAILSDTAFVGNYLSLDSSAALYQGLSSVADQTFGTLFVVIRPKLHLADSLLLQIGNIRVYPDKIRLKGVSIDSIFIKPRASIVRIKFQSPELIKKGHGRIYLNDSVEVAEVMYFKNLLDEGQCRRVESYLAFKYSINLAKNAGSMFRNYGGAGGPTYWSYSQNVDFHDEVMALGRDTTNGWRQTQSSLADSDSIVASMAPFFGQLGYMSAAPLHPGSWLIINKRTTQDSLISSPSLYCDSLNHGILLYKIQLRNWAQSNAPNLYLYSKKDLSEAGKYILFVSGADTAYNLQSSYFGLWHRVEVPVNQWGPMGRIYLGRYLNPDSCPTLKGHFSLKSCGRILVNAPEQSVLRYSSFSDSTIEHELEVSGQTEISLQPDGWYWIRLYNPLGQLLEEATTQTEQCYLAAMPGISTRKPGLDAFQLNGEGLKELKVFPNPVGQGNWVNIEALGFQDEKLQWELTDAKGAQLRKGIKPLTSNSERFTLEMPKAGTYYLRLKAASLSSMVKILVQ